MHGWGGGRGQPHGYCHEKQVVIMVPTPRHPPSLGSRMPAIRHIHSRKKVFLGESDLPKKRDVKINQITLQGQPPMASGHTASNQFLNMTNQPPNQTCNENI